MSEAILDGIAVTRCSPAMRHPPPTPTKGSTLGATPSATLPIAGATRTTYRIRKADIGKPVAVTVTGSRSSGPTDSVSCASVTVLGRLTSTWTPRISGGKTVGSVRTARAGRWRPNGVGLTYQWKRGGLAVPWATGTFYQFVPADVRQRITVTVTGSLTGYVTVATTSSAIRPRN